MPRFMILVLSNPATEAGATPTEMSEMKKFNDTLREAGMLELAEGLAPTAEGYRVSFESGDGVGFDKVEEGPFENTISGYWIVKAKSIDAVLEAATRIPFRVGKVEVRRIIGDE
ncbi:YciI family protein [Cladorrhinum sp. PSN259]|nr:YciI family protein [Cladorrhinum sp. PSN259]